MPTCWAACLADCDDKISKEHVVSKALCESDTVVVHGFAWCKDQPKEISLSNLVAKILCKKHNSDLSELDAAGGKAYAAIRTMMGTSNARAAVKPRYWTVQRYKVPGPLLERWFLKTLI
jgi:hypothetical protein